MPTFPFLPDSGQIPFYNLSHAVRTAPRRLMCADCAMLRCVLVRRNLEREWHLARTRAVIGDTWRANETAADLDQRGFTVRDHGNVRLLARQFIPSQMGTEQDLIQALWGWQYYRGGDAEPPHQLLFDAASLTRRWSRNPIDPSPGWTAHLNLRQATSFDLTDATGPFFDAETAWSEADINTLVHNWLGWAGTQSQSGHSAHRKSTYHAGPAAERIALGLPLCQFPADATELRSVDAGKCTRHLQRPVRCERYPFNVVTTEVAK